MNKACILFLTFLTILGFGAPPKSIPEKLYSDYTLNGKIPVSYWYLDCSFSPSKPRVYRKGDVDRFVNHAKARQTKYYGKLDSYLYKALDSFKKDIKGKQVAIIGSITPWYESIVLAYGGHPTIIEYNKIVCQDPRIKVLTVDQYRKNPIKFDAILSISSYEHDGLGRYGDPVDPEGDFKAMDEAVSMLKPNGKLFLAIPIGKDRLWWNAHRIYGRIRLPMLLKKWKTLSTYGFHESQFNYDEKDTWKNQPVFVLTPKNL